MGFYLNEQMMKEITMNYLDIKAIFKGGQMEVRLHFRNVLSCLKDVLYLIGYGCLAVPTQLPIHLLMCQLCIDCNHVTKMIMIKLKWN